MYLGNKPTTDQTYLSLKSQQITGTGVATYSLDYDVSSPEDLAVFINEVRQNVNTYTIDNQQITLGGNVTSSDTCYIVYLSRAVGSIAPQNNSVGSSKIIDGAVTTAKIADDAVTKDKTSDLMYPAFEATLGSTQSIAENSYVKAELDTKYFDTDSLYDNSTNYRFTPNIAGKYFVYGGLHIDTNDNNLAECRIAIYKNGSLFRDPSRFVTGTSGRGNETTMQIAYAIDFNGSTDYVELYGYINASGNTTRRFMNNYYNVFGAYRIGD